MTDELIWRDRPDDAPPYDEGLPAERFVLSTVAAQSCIDAIRALVDGRWAAGYHSVTIPEIRAILDEVSR